MIDFFYIPEGMAGECDLKQFSGCEDTWMSHFVRDLGISAPTQLQAGCLVDRRNYLVLGRTYRPVDL